MNILLTNECSASCTYCFAKEEQHKTVNKYMKIEDFVYLLDLLRDSNIGEVRLLGGEPTLHPHFAHILDLIADYGMHVFLVTNAVLPEKKVQSILKYEETTRILCNMSTALNGTQTRVRNSALQKIGHMVVPSYTFSLDNKITVADIVQDIETFGMLRRARLSIAHPIVGAANNYVPVEHFSLVGTTLLSFSDALREHDIACHMDCGLCHCMFPRGVRSYLNDDMFNCGVLPDVDVDMNTFPCFPLTNFKRARVKDFKTVDAIREHFDTLLEPYRMVGCKTECMTCPYEHKCTTGCLGHKIKM